MPVPSLLAALPAEGVVGLLTTALVLGFRHGFDWDHLAAITDVTSTTATADAAELGHEAVHEETREHAHGHGGADELTVHAGVISEGRQVVAQPGPRLVVEQRRALLLGSLYALGHGTVVAVLGLLALAFGAVLPDWVDPIMG